MLNEKIVHVLVFYRLQWLKFETQTLRTLMFKTRSMWKRGWGGINFNNFICTFVENMCHRILVAVRQFGVVIAYCMCRVCWPRSQRSHWDLRNPAPNLEWHIIATKIQKILLKIDAIGSTLPHESDFQHQCFKCFCLFNFQPFCYTFTWLWNFSVI